MSSCARTNDGTTSRHMVTNPWPRGLPLKPSYAARQQEKAPNTTSTSSGTCTPGTLHSTHLLPPSGTDPWTANSSTQQPQQTIQQHKAEETLEDIHQRMVESHQRMVERHQRMVESQQKQAEEEETRLAEFDTWRNTMLTRLYDNCPSYTEQQHEPAGPSKGEPTTSSNTQHSMHLDIPTGSDAWNVPSSTQQHPPHTQQPNTQQREEESLEDLTKRMNEEAKTAAKRAVVAAQESATYLANHQAWTTKMMDRLNNIKTLSNADTGTVPSPISNYDTPTSTQHHQPNEKGTPTMREPTNNTISIVPNNNTHTQTNGDDNPTTREVLAAHTIQHQFRIFYTHHQYCQQKAATQIQHWIQRYSPTNNKETTILDLEEHPEEDTTAKYNEYNHTLMGGNEHNNKMKTYAFVWSKHTSPDATSALAMLVCGDEVYNFATNLSKLVIKQYAKPQPPPEPPPLTRMFYFIFSFPDLALFCIMLPLNNTLQNNGPRQYILDLLFTKTNEGIFSLRTRHD